MSITPITKDKRFQLTAGTILYVLTLVAFGRSPDGAVLGFLTATLAWFSAQSQYGQTKRTIAEAKNALAPNQ